MKKSADFVGESDSMRVCLAISAMEAGSGIESARESRRFLITDRLGSTKVDEEVDDDDDGDDNDDANLWLNPIPGQSIAITRSNCDDKES